MPDETNLVEIPGINRTNLRALISRIKSDSGNRMSFLDAALFVGMMLDRELRECADDMAKAEARGDRTDQKVKM